MPRPSADPAPGSHTVDAVVLAAGRSRRMGVPKPLLKVDGEAFIERVIRTLRGGGCRRVVVVAGADANRLPRVVQQTGALCVVNPDPDSEQVESLRLGLAGVGDDAVAAVVLPVDHPLVRPATVAALIRAYGDRRAPVVRAVYAGEPGHPALIDRSLFAEFDERPLPRGAETVLERHEAEIEDVDVDDAGALADIDTPEDYRRYVERS